MAQYDEFNEREAPGGKKKAMEWTGKIYFVLLFSLKKINYTIVALVIRHETVIRREKRKCRPTRIS